VARDGLGARPCAGVVAGGRGAAFCACVRSSGAGSGARSWAGGADYHRARFAAPAPHAPGASRRPRPGDGDRPWPWRTAIGTDGATFDSTGCASA